MKKILSWTWIASVFTFGIGGLVYGCIVGDFGAQMCTSILGLGAGAFLTEKAFNYLFPERKSR